MDILEQYHQNKKKNEPFIHNRHLYVANIIKNLFSPTQHKNLCEIGAGRFELAIILATFYENIDAYEIIKYPKPKISNLKIYDVFNRYTNVSNYHLMISVCPYSCAYDIFDEIDPEEESKRLIFDILDLSVENKINSFIVLPNTPIANNIIENVKNQEKYNKIIQDDIVLNYQFYNKKETSKFKVLIYKK